MLGSLHSPIFFFLLTPIFFSFSPNAEPGLRLRGWLYLQAKAALHLVLVQGVVFTQWYLTCFLLPFLINFLQAYLSGWGGEGVCVCVTSWVGIDAMLFCKTGAANL